MEAELVSSTAAAEEYTTSSSSLLFAVHAVIAGLISDIGGDNKDTAVTKREEVAYMPAAHPSQTEEPGVEAAEPKAHGLQMAAPRLSE